MQGIFNTMGQYLTYYSLDILKTESPSTIAWIGSIQAFLLMFVGSLTGAIYVGDPRLSESLSDHPRIPAIFENCF
jgi:hypothetical protein